MKGNHAGAAPEQSGARGLRSALAWGLALALRLQRQRGQLVFQASKVKVQRLIQPLRIVGAASVFLRGFFGAQKQRQQRDGHRHQQQQGGQPRHGAAVRRRRRALNPVEHVKVERGR